VDGLVDSQLKGKPKVLFVENIELWEPWILNRMERAGFRVSVRNVGNFKLLVFDR
jgi:hypothetical protein